LKVSEDAKDLQTRWKRISGSRYSAQVTAQMLLNLIDRNHNAQVVPCVFLALGFAGSSTVESYLVPGAYSGTIKSKGKERIFD